MWSSIASWSKLLPLGQEVRAAIQLKGLESDSALLNAHPPIESSNHFCCTPSTKRLASMICGFVWPWYRVAENLLVQELTKLRIVRY